VTRKFFYIFLFDVLNEFATPRHIELSVRNIRPFSVVMHSDSFGNLAIPGRRLVSFYAHRFASRLQEEFDRMAFTTADVDNRFDVEQLDRPGPKVDHLSAN